MLSGERFEFFDECEDRGAVPNIELVMTKGGEGLSEAVLVPAGVSAWAEEVGSLIVVDAVDFLATGGKEGNHFRSDQTRGAGYEEFHACYLCGRWDGEGKGIFGPALLLTRFAEELRRAARICP